MGVCCPEKSVSKKKESLSSHLQKSHFTCQLLFVLKALLLESCDDASLSLTVRTKPSCFVVGGENEKSVVMVS